MSTELEDEIRTALRESAESVTRARLRYADGPRDRVRRRAALYAALAAAAVVVAIAIGASLWTANRASTPAGGTGADTLAGTGWRLVSVTGPHGTIAIPGELAAGVQFPLGGRFVAEDGVNAYSGGYRADSTGIFISDVSGSAAGYVGADSVQLAAIEGIQALFVSGTDRPVHVGVQEHGAHLTLRAGKYTLRLSYEGRADEATATASASASATQS